jgi:transcriptional regulator with AAA-type ATPase domain
LQPACDIAEGVPGPTDLTFTESSIAPMPLARPEAHLVVVLECDRPLSGSSRHSLRGVVEVTLGRGAERAALREGDRLALTIPSGWMSGAHVRLRLERERWRIEDLGSRNGTCVNGKPVAHLALADGDLIEAGRALLLFRPAWHAPPTQALDFDTRSATFPAPGLGTVLPALEGEVDALVRVAASPIPILLRGETGTGKEVTARAVHALSKRKGSFVPVNCGAIPGTLVESHLFGHVKGAFSGAVRDEPGFVRAASGGTLFLDEIGDLPPTSQAALLRVLQEREVTPVGATRSAPVDLRVVAATHQRLEALVARGDFRADLLARLDGFTFALPPLRERREDTGVLVGDLLRGLPGLSNRLELSPEVARALLQYEWPFNIRELEHCLARACALAQGEARLELRHLSPQVRAALGPDPSANEPADSVGQPPLRAQLERLLAEHDGDVAQVARALGKARMQVYRWLKRFAIDPERYRRG